MPESATNRDMVRMVVPGEARPYRERAHTYLHAKPGKRGQPVASLTHCQLQADELAGDVELGEATGDLFRDDADG